MSYLIDTCIVSEVRKGEDCNVHVARWYESLAEQDLYLSVLVVGEIRKGIEMIRADDAAQAAALDRWLALLESGFGDRILPVDMAVVMEWGRLAGCSRGSTIAGLMAATAKANDLVLVTNDRAHVETVQYLNPFTANG